MKSNIKLKISKRIKELRKEIKISQQELSELTGIDYKYIQKIEGKNPPNMQIETLEKIARAFKISVFELVYF